MNRHNSWRLLFVTGTILYAALISEVFEHTTTSTSTTTSSSRTGSSSSGSSSSTTTTSSKPRNTCVEAFSPKFAEARRSTLKLSSQASNADLLQDLPFVPEEVMKKFMTAVGDPLTAGSLQAGYQAGAVSKDELDEIRTKLPGMEASTTDTPRVQSLETIESHWKAALEGQPWHVQSMGKLATKTIVPLVAKLQEKSVNQANAMKWINENALPIIQKNSTIVGLLSSSTSEENQQIAFHNTRAKFETDRGVWSASMDVFVPTRDGKVETKELSKAGTALEALKEGMGDEGISSFDVSVLEDSFDVGNSTNTGATTDVSKKVGLVNAYFLPDDEIKILVVEIDGILHNVTWKGLDG